MRIRTHDGRMQLPVNTTRPRRQEVTDEETQNIHNLNDQLIIINIIIKGGSLWIMDYVGRGRGKSEQPLCTIITTLHNFYFCIGKIENV